MCSKTGIIFRYSHIFIHIFTKQNNEFYSCKAWIFFKAAWLLGQQFTSATQAFYLPCSSQVNIIFAVIPHRFAEKVISRVDHRLPLCIDFVPWVQMLICSQEALLMVHYPFIFFILHKWDLNVANWTFDTLTPRPNLHTAVPSVNQGCFERLFHWFLLFDAISQHALPEELA